MLDRRGIPALLLGESGSKSLMFEDAVGTLLEFSFIKEENVGAVFAMHRLVQLATRKWLELYQKTEDCKEKAVGVLSDHYPDGYYEDWNRM